MEQLLSLGTALNLPKLGPAKSMWLGLVAAAVLVAVGYIAMRPSEQMGLLYSGIDPAEAGKVGQRLDELKVPYEAKSDGGTILVPASMVAKVRMELAASGLPHQGGVGYELLDSQSPMNMTSFMQRVQRVRALEGELARTIATLSGVKYARVHLVLPEREGFSRETPKPTASVTVTMEGAGRLSTSQAAAIRLLVAGAVPRMQQDDVSVLDPSGVVLAANGGAASMAMGRMDEIRTAEEQGVQQTVTGLLEPLLGRGNVRVAASLDLDGVRETQREEKFDPLSQVERSKQIQNDRDSSEENKAQQAVTVGQNLPNQQPQGGGGNNRNSTTSSHSNETVNYELSSVTSERVREPGALKRLTVAVVVNGATDAKGVYVPRTKEELDRLAELVRSAVGFNEKRGDKITVETMPFAPLDLMGTGSDAGVQAAALPLKILIPAGLGVLLLLVGMGMLLMRRSRARAELVPMDADPAQITMADPVENLFSITAVGGTHRSPLLIQLNNMVDERPDETLAVLRGWITEGMTP